MSEKIEVKVKQHNPHEQVSHSKEHLAKIEHGHAEKAARHSTAEKHHEAESARSEANEEAISGAEYEQPQSESSSQTQSYHTKLDKLHSFNTTMHHARKSMSRTERQFSKLIHQPIVEKTSEVVGKTVARPSGIVGATIAAFIGLLSIYSIAKFAGFQLSGLEMPLLLLAGFAVGILIEWLFKASRALLLKKG